MTWVGGSGDDDDDDNKKSRKNYNPLPQPTNFL